MNSSTEPKSTNGKFVNKYSKNQLEKIKSIYFLQNRLFDILTKNKFLEIIKYNKTMQKQLNLDIKDYQEYSEIFSPIELELTPIKNGFGNFINLFGEEEKTSHFHIFFDNNKSETKIYALNEDDNISKIKIIIDHQIKSFEELFKYSNCIESINFKKFYRTNINNMRQMFFGCEKLKNLILLNFKTNNVIDMSYMFYNCSSLKELNLSNFNTNNVTNMSCMFSGCSSLKELNLNNFNTNNVTNIRYMFSKCSYDLKMKNSYPDLFISE